MDISEILKTVKDRDIRTIKLWFVDIVGFNKMFTITPSELQGALEEGMGFDGSSIEGFTRIQESDMIARPDPHTFMIDPFSEDDGEGLEARMICDIYKPEGKPYEGDPRNVLRRVMKKVTDMGYTQAYLGPELEYFYFKSPEHPEPIDPGGYFDDPVQELGEKMRKTTVNMLERYGIQIEYAHHEVAPSQHEIDMRFRDALQMADQVMTYKYVVKKVAARFGCYASFMPKPIQGVNGSGMHVHQSLSKDGRNTFFDAKADYYLSDTAKHYMAGILKHISEFVLVTNQWTNSYKRLVPGYEAPVYISWAQKNRSALIRVPIYKPGREQATRIECRHPDPSCNPYLAFAAMIGAGIKGIAEKYPLQPPTDDNIFKMTEEEREAAGIHSLPGGLGQAIHRFEESTFMRELLGETCYNAVLRNKQYIWNEYRAEVSPYELKNLYPVL